MAHRIGNGQDFGFYTRCNEKLLKDFGQASYMR